MDRFEELLEWLRVTGKHEAGRRIASLANEQCIRPACPYSPIVPGRSRRPFSASSEVERIARTMLAWKAASARNAP
jgi:hypothetical protein